MEMQSLKNLSRKRTFNPSKPQCSKKMSDTQHMSTEFYCEKIIQMIHLKCTNTNVAKLFTAIAKIQSNERHQCGPYCKLEAV